MLPRMLPLLLLFLSACLPAAPEATATRRFTAPTLAPSPTVNIRTSDEIYGDSIRDGQNDPTAAALPRDSALPPLDTGNVSEGGALIVDLFLSDGTALSAYLYQPKTEGR